MKFYKTKNNNGDMCPNIKIQFAKPKSHVTKGCIIFTDLKSSSKIWGHKTSKKWEMSVLSWIETHFNIIKDLIKYFNKIYKKGGKIIKTEGDASMIYCPWKLDICIKFAICMQNKMRQLNKKICDSIGTSEKNKLYKKISKEKLPDTVFSIRIGLCYGIFESIISPIQSCRSFEDFFGPAVNLSSRMESVITSLPGGISITIYMPNKNKKQLNEYLEKHLEKIKNYCSGYKLYTFNTDVNNNIDLEKLLHGALPHNTVLPISVLVPNEYRKSQHRIINKIF